MSILQGFEAVNPAAPSGKTMLTVTPRYIRFNKNTVLELGSPDYVQLLTNPHTKQIAIKVCGPNDPNAIPFVKATRNTASVTLSMPIVMDAVLKFFDFPGVAQDEVAYAHVAGTPFLNDKTVIFDASDVKTGVMKKRGRKKNKVYPR